MNQNECSDPRVGLTVLYLYAEVMGYTMCTIRELAQVFGCKVHVVHWDRRKLTPYLHYPVEGVSFYDRSGYDEHTIEALALRLRPDIVVVSGWMDAGYWRALRAMRVGGVPVVIGFDDQWHSTARQLIGAMIMKRWRRRYFTHAWVAGPYQYEFARKLGFGKERIVWNLYSGDVALFNDSFFRSAALKAKRYPHRFLFVGRLDPVKGVATLLSAWESISSEVLDWELHFVGSGPLAADVQAAKRVSHKEFLQPRELALEAETAGCFILPSHSEAWGVVLHEFSAAGLPVICTRTCGAAPMFVVDGYNGYKCAPMDVEGLQRVILKMIRKRDDELKTMGVRSHELGQRITPAQSAGCLLEVALVKSK